jgi:hypothetical protein
VTVGWAAGRRREGGSDPRWVTSRVVWQPLGFGLAEAKKTRL